MRKLVVGATASLLLVLVSVGAVAQTKPTFYIEPEQADLIHLIAPPPAAGSVAAKADLKAVLDMQKKRSAAEIAEAQAADKATIFDNFADLLGPDFRADKLPFVKTFFDQVHADGFRAVSVAKAYFKRLRPYETDSSVSPVTDHKADQASYPSGHAFIGYADAVLLAEMVPEKSAALFARASRIANDRLIAGVHYPTDLESGRISGAVVDNVLLHEPRFIVDLEKARAELRHGIGLPELAADLK